MNIETKSEEKKEFYVSAIHAGERLDAFVASSLSLIPSLASIFSRSQVHRLIKNERVSVNGELVSKPAYKVAENDQVTVLLPAPEASSLVAEDPQSLSILFEDDDILVINKPAGISVHPGAGQKSGTLANQLVSYLGEGLRQIGDSLRPGIVHRLDKDTSGLMVIAKTAASYQALVKQFQPPRTMTRKYLLLTFQVPRAQPGSSLSPDGRSGSIVMPIGRSPSNRKKMAVLPNGRPAETQWKLLERYSQAVLIEASLQTGRTHQIRVHFQHNGAALIGDILYRGNPERFPANIRAAVKKFGRQALHASKLEFFHPCTNERLQFESELPSDFRELLQYFRE